MSDDDFLHGVEILEGEAEKALLNLSNQGVIGLIGTAPEADEDRFPLNVPVLVAGSEKEAAFLGDEGTLPEAFECIFKQSKPQVVVVRVEAGDTEAETLNGIIGGYDADTDAYSGVHAFKAAKAALGMAPKILIAPGFSNVEAVATELRLVADDLTASVALDGPNTNDADAQAYMKKFAGAKNVYVVDPFMKVPTVEGTKLVATSALVAGIMAGQPYYESPSNIVIKGVTGTARPVDFRHGDVNCRANILNKNCVATVIYEDGFRLWGNLTAAGTFLSSYRIKNYMKEGIRAVAFPYVDRNMSESKVDFVLRRVNAFLNGMVTNDKSLRHGVATLHKTKNNADTRRKGRIVFVVSYEDVTPMQRMTFELELEVGE